MSAETIHGQCPLCKSNAEFRELTFTENLSSLGKFVGEFFQGGHKAKENIAAAASSIADSREFPNYICNHCAGEVMQCGECNEIIPYAHDGASHVCSFSKLCSDAS